MNELQKPYVSVIDPITTAIQRVKLILFDPFEIEKWFIIGFCAWLANVTEAFANFCDVIVNLCDGLAESGEFIRHHLQVIIIVAVIVMLLVLTIGIICLWLSSRGKFMFLHCVAENKGQVGIPWRKYGRQGNSLFLFRLALAFISLLCFGLLIGGGIVLGIVFTRGHSPAGVIVTIIIAVPLFLVLLVVFGVIGKFLKDFVVPIMYIEESTCMAGWSRFGSVLSANKGRFALYILFQIVIGMVIVTIVLAAILVTCCCACCILGIPYIGTVLMLPILVFERSYSLYYLGQYGPEFDVFARAQYEAAPGEFGPAAV